MTRNTQLELASDYVQFTDKNIFLTGKAGTGKTTFLHNLRKNCPKRIVVVAPTGVAAINAGGSTIHSFFQLPFGPFIPNQVNADKTNFNRKINKEKINLIKSIDLLVIDEISMVRADTLDAIDEVLRRFRDHHKAFGGVQLLMIGDLHQLSPVIKDDEWRLLKDYYENVYFFNSQALKQTQPVSIELKHIYRQSDTSFIDILNAVRENKIDKETLDKLNSRYIPDFKPGNEEGYITLTSHNQSAHQINEEKLKEIIGKEHHFKAVIDGDFPEYSYPNAVELTFKIGAQVMFVKNDISRDKLYFNGKIGKITKIGSESIHVKCPGDFQEIIVTISEWENYKFELNPATKEIEEKVIGSFFQYPLKLAWAITIHKSQGLTFEKAIIDANAAFAHGQVYVALSRCKNFEGMVLRTPISYQSVKTDGNVATYTKNAEENAPKEQDLQQSKINFQQGLLLELFDFNGLKSALFHIKKLAEENYNIINDGYLDNINLCRADAEKTIYEVADKFKRHLNLQLQQNDLPESNQELQERVIKACTYFKTNLESLKLQLEQSDFDCDNKAVKKSIKDAIDTLNRVLYVKQSAINLCHAGFKTLDYLKNKANAEIDFNNLKKVEIPEKPKAAPTGTKNGDLYHIIKKWRDGLASENNVPVYQILPQKVLTDLANSLPSNFEELESIKGIGKIKVKQYGNEILIMIADYCEANDIARNNKLIDVLPKKEKIDTKQISLNLFREGKSIQEIAEERALAASTIETHLAHFVSTEALSIYDFMDKNKVDNVITYISTQKLPSTNQIKEALGNEVTYGEIKAVIAHLSVNETL